MPAEITTAGGSAIELEENTRLLSRVDLLEPLSRKEVEELPQRVPVMRFERSWRIYTPAYRADIFFLLLQGRVRVYKKVGGQEVTLALVGEGETFGEEAVFASRRSYGAYAEALEPSRVALMSRGTFERLVQDRSEVGMRAIKLLSERLSFYEDRIADIGLKEVPARLASLILQLVEDEGVATREGLKISTRYTHEQLGLMIAAQRVAVTRAITDLRKAGTVESRHRQIYVKDMEALEGAAER